MARPASLNRFPLLTLTVAGGALLVFCWPFLAGLLVYDRGAIFAGEIWRLVSAPLVHFSLSHLGWNLVVFCAAGGLAEIEDAAGFGRVCTLAALTTGPLFLLTDPELIRYGGLSGLATGALTYLCLLRLQALTPGRWLWMLLLLLVGAKILGEIYSGQPFFVASLPGYHVLPAAHLLGAGGALLVAIGPRLRLAWVIQLWGRRCTQWRKD